MPIAPFQPPDQKCSTCGHYDCYCDGTEHDCADSAWRWLDCDECEECEIKVCVDCGATINE